MAADNGIRQARYGYRFSRPCPNSCGSSDTAIFIYTTSGGCGVFCADTPAFLICQGCGVREVAKSVDVIDGITDPVEN